MTTVGSIHGGNQTQYHWRNRHLQITVRSYSAEVRKQLLDAIQRRAQGVASTWNAPMPKIAISEGRRPLNDVSQFPPIECGSFGVTTEATVCSMRSRSRGGGLCQYGLAGVPIMMYRLGVISPERMERHLKLDKPLPSLHSEFILTLKEPWKQAWHRLSMLPWIF
ncbi:MAG: hypothetical protein U0905_05020 [Pirellulales bacterium]